VPAGAALTSLSYCGVLYLGGSIPADQFFLAVCHYWIGDTVGILTIIPLVTSLFVLFSMPTWPWSGHMSVSYVVFILGTCLAFAVVIGGVETKQYHIFYTLFLPVIWIGMREGYAGVAVGLLVVQLGLVAATAFIRSDTNDFYIFQTLMLVLLLCPVSVHIYRSRGVLFAQAPTRAGPAAGPWSLTSSGVPVSDLSHCIRPEIG
jgi:integral membrane sensor domain MASE1